MKIARGVVWVAACAALWGSGCSGVMWRFATRSITAPARNEQPSDPLPEPVLPDVGLSVLWVGHASALIQIHDKVIITDPSLTSTVGMVSRRLIDPGLDPRTLHHLNATLISHLHFDHFEYGALDALPKDGLLMIPPGGADYTPEFGFADTRESAAWHTEEWEGMKITPVPVKHFGGRYGLDIVWSHDGYTGYVIEYHGVTVLFCGDTGYDSTMFKEIGKRFHIDLALIPIAPMEPHEFMKRVHADPAEALQIFDDVHARWMIPIHHRTFEQGFDPSPEAAQDTLMALAAGKKIADRVKVLDIGERTVVIP